MKHACLLSWEWLCFMCTKANAAREPLEHAEWLLKEWYSVSWAHPVALIAVPCNEWMRGHYCQYS